MVKLSQYKQSPLLGAAARSAIFIAGIKVAILKYDPTIFLNLEAEETGWNLFKRGAVPNNNQEHSS